MTKHRLTASILLIPVLTTGAVLDAQGGESGPGLSARRSLDQALQPSEAEISKRMTPVVRAVQATADSVISVHLYGGRRLMGQGSGVIIEESGLALSNWHVVQPALRDPRIKVQVAMKDGQMISARVLSTSARHDLALLQMTDLGERKLKPVTMGDSDSLMIGETVIAIGNPKGHANTVTVGVLSASKREIQVRSPDGIRKYSGLLQTDAAINQGNSGGALLDITGKLVGINNAMANDSENIGFAIPVNTVRRVFHEVLLSSDRLANVYLGLRIAEDRGRVLLADVTKGSPAWRAGLRQGDQLLKVSKQAIRNKIDYARAILASKPQHRLPLTILRDGRRRVLSPRPISNAAWQILSRIGLEFETVTPAQDKDLLSNATLRLYRELRRQPRYLLPSVLRVRHVQPGSSAARLKFSKGDIFLGLVDSVPSFLGRQAQFRGVTTVDELSDLLRSIQQRERGASSREVWVMRGDQIHEGQLQIDAG